jgi:hypothetical protein
MITTLIGLAMTVVALTPDPVVEPSPAPEDAVMVSSADEDEDEDDVDTANGDCSNDR